MKTILILTSLLIAGCEEDKHKSVSRPDKREIRYYTVDIEGCEYLSWDGSHSEKAITHKGNCKYCVSRKGGLEKP